MKPLAACGVVLMVLGCSGCSTDTGLGEYRTTATIKDIMDSLVDPSADVIWESVAEIVTETGTEVRRPRTDDEWKSVRRAAVRIVEATNLLQMTGRSVARPGEKSENPGIELGPEEVNALIQADRPTFITHANELQAVAREAVSAIDSRNGDALFTVGERLDRACETCHLLYWYPPGKAPKGGGSVR